MHPELKPLFRPDQPNQSEQELKRFLFQAKRRGDPELCSQVTGLILRCQVLDDRLDAATETLNDLQFLLIQSKLKGGDCEARYWMEKAILFQAMGWEETAQEDALKSLELASEPVREELEQLARSSCLLHSGS